MTIIIIIIITTTIIIIIIKINKLVCHTASLVDSHTVSCCIKIHTLIFWHLVKLTTVAVVKHNLYVNCHMVSYDPLSAGCFYCNGFSIY